MSYEEDELWKPSYAEAKDDFFGLWREAETELKDVKQRLAAAEKVVEAAVDIQIKANLKGDHATYDLMRTILDAAKEAEDDEHK